MEWTPLSPILFAKLLGSSGSADVTAAAVASAIGDMSSAQAEQALEDLGGEPKELSVTVSDAAATITPAANTVYNCTAAALTSLTITDPPVTGEYTIVFSSGATATTTTIPSSILGLESFAPEANTVYEINVLDNRAVYHGWSVSV